MDPLAMLVSTLASALGATDIAEEWLRRARQELTNAQRERRLWARTHYMLGIPSAILSGGAGVTAVAAGPAWLSASLAFGSAVVSAVYVFLRPNAKLEASERKVGEQEAYVMQIEAALAIDLSGDQIDREAARKVLEQLAQRQRQLRLGTAGTALDGEQRSPE